MLTPLDEKTTKLTIMLEIDMKGSIPAKILSVANHDQAFQIFRLRTVLANYCAKKGIKF